MLTEMRRLALQCCVVAIGVQAGIVIGDIAAHIIRRAL
jgi:hypothetical protein